ncbi:Ig-like domain-containing protein [Methanobrevibacter sp.]|uniref:Ig-like domain-containing protein n=1 Tax=Methanobrevibacter sp. TaxID=66852 RepID=UPI003868198E
MERNQIIIIALIVIIAVLLVGIAAMMMPNMAKQDTKLKFKSNSTLTEGESLKVKLTDVNGTALANQTVNITITGKNGSSDYHSVVTNKKGIGTLKLDKNPGKYTVNVTYGGNENYTGNTTTQKLTVKEEEKVVASQSSSSSSDTYVERSDGTLTYGYKDGRYGFWTPSGNFIEDKSRALSGEDPVEPFMRDGDFYSQL